MTAVVRYEGLSDKVRRTNRNSISSEIVAASVADMASDPVSTRYCVKADIIRVSLKSCAGGSCWQISSGYVSCSKWCPIVRGPPQHSSNRVLESRIGNAVTQSQQSSTCDTEGMGEQI